jgi:enamine deaminase RidA (YjgF/YER057c/UK114 family)
MSKTAITSPELTPPAGPFSQAVEVAGFLYLSGQVGQDPATGKLRITTAGEPQTLRLRYKAIVPQGVKLRRVHNGA